MIDWDTFKAQLETNPGKLLKSVLLLAGCFLAIWIIVVLQSDPSVQNTIQVEESGRLDSLRISSNTTQQGHSQLRPTRTNDPGGTEMYSLLPWTLFLLVCLAGVWLWVRSKNSASGSSTGSQLFQTVGAQQLPCGQQLVVIRLNDEYWVMTSGAAQGMNLLHRYDADEWQGPVNPPEKTDWKNTFLETLHSASAKSDKG